MTHSKPPRGFRQTQEEARHVLESYDLGRLLRSHKAIIEQVHACDQTGYLDGVRLMRDLQREVWDRSQRLNALVRMLARALKSPRSPIFRFYVWRLGRLREEAFQSGDEWEAEAWNFTIDFLITERTARCSGAEPSAHALAGLKHSVNSLHADTMFCGWFRGDELVQFGHTYSLTMRMLLLAMRVPGSSAELGAVANAPSLAEELDTRIARLPALNETGHQRLRRLAFVLATLISAVETSLAEPGARE